MMNDRIVITRPLPGDVVAMFKNAGYTNLWCPEADEPLPREKLLEVIGGACGLVCNPGDKAINAEVFDAAGAQLKVVATFAVGTDNIDLAEAARRRIVVGNTPVHVTEPTADIAWLLLLGAARRAHEGENLARSGKWTGIGPAMLLGRRMIGRNLLLIGAGRIAQAVARRSVGWEMKVTYFSRSRREEMEQPPINGERVELDKGLAEADFVSLHVPLTDQTRHLITAEKLGLMKPSAILINTARGPVVDEAALVEALKAGRIAAAGLDVYEQEPKLAPGLAELENAFLMPHIGSATVEDRTWMTESTVENVVAVLRGEEPPYPIQA